MSLPEIGQTSEGAAIITLTFVIYGEVTTLPFLQGMSYIAATILACLTLFLNRKKYWESFKETELYKWIKNGIQKINRRTS